ncbi:hypothetical protein AKA01nite_06990 [Alkalibacterium kapii]|uniref:CAT RNA-binding domain-containing protein n=2 Tax=Alkalibacterium kapii TaxID=426704 RepID=A0A511AZR4_9LACT|nr:hypothetical protein AKA01nite_06990 [Alkalibacterium kapii]
MQAKPELIRERTFRQILPEREFGINLGLFFWYDLLSRGCQYSAMKIEKILNNNVVLTLNESNQETVVMGRGIAFQKKVGETIESEKIEKNFVPEGQDVVEHLSDLYRDIDPYILEVATNVIKYAQSILRLK